VFRLHSFNGLRLLTQPEAQRCRRLSFVMSPVGTADNSPRREPWEQSVKMTEAPEGRKTCSTSLLSPLRG
jgi:hypothetical protein